MTVKAVKVELTQEEKDRRKNASLRVNYGITLAQYKEMLKAQGGVCAICGGVEKMYGRSLGVDHDHETQEIRGLLCNECNVGLGKFKESISIMIAAINYLRRYED